ncbi:hypothetical protein SLS58_010910 [Diplodia intermedia]|uniref:Fungal specific transcription factor n=1 Tax=Diplodia intermedia TaxID=856260 RepID=A0ABR3T2W9_9PEZI
MPLSSERIVSTSTGDVLGSRWGRPQPASAPPPAAHQSTPPTPQAQAAQTKINGGGDIIGSRRTAAAPPPEPIVSTIDEGDIIGHARRWVPTIDRRSSTTTTTNSSSSNQLLQSRYAASSSRPRIPTAAGDPTTPSPHHQPHDHDPQLSKLKRLIDRLSWKSHTLLFTQSVALASSAAAPSTYAAQPTTMFKLDFFEYYALLERILVLFLAYFRVPLPSAYKSPSSSTPLPPISGRGVWRGHRYHESVLEALEGTRAEGGEGDAAALGAALGSEDVVAVLRRAKAFRNRWKDADEQEQEQGVVGPAWEGQREEVEGLGLGELLEVVLGALERAYRAAEEKAGAGGKGLDGGGGGGAGGEGTWLEVGGLHGGYVDEDMEDAPWEAVGDAMEDVMDMDVE